MNVVIPPGLSAADEAHHPPGEGEWWGESWYFDFATADGRLGGYVRLGVYPHRGVAWYWACLVGEACPYPLVAVVDHEVRPPRPPSREIRAEGLWADHNTEMPFDHVTLGCEAFALGLDDPATMLAAGGTPLGDRVPLGLDLEWETEGAAYAYPPGATRYEVPCRVHGEVLVGDERMEVDAAGERDHSWGPRDWWGPGWTWWAGGLDDGTRFHGVVVRQPDGEIVPYHPGFVQPPGGLPAAVDHTAEAPMSGDRGFPVATTLTTGDLRVEAEPVAFAPVLLDDGGGRLSYLVRALARFRVPGTGRAGTGWVEWNWPQPGPPG
jgi:hypothetical protein